MFMNIFNLSGSSIQYEISYTKKIIFIILVAPDLGVGSLSSCMKVQYMYKHNFVDVINDLSILHGGGTLEIFAIIPILCSMLSYIASCPAICNYYLLACVPALSCRV